jgi:hypothetical protein
MVENFVANRQIYAKDMKVNVQEIMMVALELALFVVKRIVKVSVCLIAMVVFGLPRMIAVINGARQTLHANLVKVIVIQMLTALILYSTGVRQLKCVLKNHIFLSVNFQTTSLLSKFS